MKLILLTKTIPDDPYCAPGTNIIGVFTEEGLEKYYKLHPEIQDDRDYEETEIEVDDMKSDPDGFVTY
jgi:hypothetical protein